MSTLVARDLKVRLGRRDVLDGIDLDLAPGRLVGLIGPNGAGKTTLLRALVGLLPAAQGSVALDGVPLESVPAIERARAIAYLPQSGGVAWPLAVTDLVALGRLPHQRGMGSSDLQGPGAVARAMEAAGIVHLRSRIATELSGGERARAMLARALAGEPRVLLADEPVSALDPHHQLGVMELLRQRAREGMLVVAVLHDLGLAARFCDRVVLLDRGRKAGDGSPAEVLTERALADTYHVVAALGRHEGVLTVLPWSRLPMPDDGEGAT